MLLTTKKTILVFIDWFWPGYLAGGPVQSIVSIVQYLKEEYDFKIVTTNSDIDGKPYPTIETNTWIQSPLGCTIFYIDKSTITKHNIAELLSVTSFDVIYINSFFSKYFSIIPLQIVKTLALQQQVIVAPRGMLGAGALQIKGWKKKVFIAYAKLIGLHKDVIWQATSEQEVTEIKKVIGDKCNVKNVSNLPKKIIEPKVVKTKFRNSVNLCFVSRISQKKNLHYALQILKTVGNCSINFSIIGPIEDKVYWAKCQLLIKELPKTITVTHKGSYKPEDIKTVFENEHALFLPTLNENFGHAIVESLLCACPVIISNQTPWVDLEEHNAGYSLDLNDTNLFIKVIYMFAAFNEEELTQKNKAAVEYIYKKLNVVSIISDYKQLFS